MSKKATKVAGIAIALSAFLGTNSLFAGTTPKFPNAQVMGYSGNTKLPNFIRLNDDQNIPESEFQSWIANALSLPVNVTFRSYDSEKDNQGMTHTRYREFVNNIPVQGSMIIVHSKDGRMSMINGDRKS